MDIIVSAGTQVDLDIEVMEMEEATQNNCQLFSGRWEGIDAPARVGPCKEKGSEQTHQLTETVLHKFEMVDDYGKVRFSKKEKRVVKRMLVRVVKSKEVIPLGSEGRTWDCCGRNFSSFQDIYTHTWASHMDVVVAGIKEEVNQQPRGSLGLNVADREVLHSIEASRLGEDVLELLHETPGRSSDPIWFERNGFVVLLFYKFAEIKNEEYFVKFHHDLCRTLELTGKARISKEGMNVTVAGSFYNAGKYISLLTKTCCDLDTGDTLEPSGEIKANFNSLGLRCSDFKTSVGTKHHAFVGLSTKVVEELVTLGAPSAIESNGGIHISPEMFHSEIEKLSRQWKSKDLSSSQIPTVLLDLRNFYEWKVGRFQMGSSDLNKSAIVLPNIRKFSSFPNYLKDNIDKFRGKRVLMCCTGGIRCENSSRLLRQSGVCEEIYQLEGGIHKYLEAFGSSGYFKGNLFVFDERLTLPSGLFDSPCKRRVIGTDGKLLRSQHSVTDPYELPDINNHAGSTHGTVQRSDSGDNEPLGLCDFCHREWNNYILCRGISCRLLVSSCIDCQTQACARNEVLFCSTLCMTKTQGVLRAIAEMLSSDLQALVLRRLANGGSGDSPNNSGIFMQGQLLKEQPLASCSIAASGKKGENCICSSYTNLEALLAVLLINSEDKVDDVANNTHSAAAGFLDLESQLLEAQTCLAACKCSVYHMLLFLRENYSKLRVPADTDAASAASTTGAVPADQHIIEKELKYSSGAALTRCSVSLRNYSTDHHECSPDPNTSFRSSSISSRGAGTPFAAGLYVTASNSALETRSICSCEPRTSDVLRQYTGSCKSSTCSNAYCACSNQRYRRPSCAAACTSAGSCVIRSTSCTYGVATRRGADDCVSTSSSSTRRTKYFEAAGDRGNDRHQLIAGDIMSFEERWNIVHFATELIATSSAYSHIFDDYSTAAEPNSCDHLQQSMSTKPGTSGRSFSSAYASRIRLERDPLLGDVSRADNIIRSVDYIAHMIYEEMFDSILVNNRNIIMRARHETYKDSFFNYSRTYGKLFHKIDVIVNKSAA
eukprot:Nk52_evm2s233 gene=Nk52_evmTU2s233